MSIDNRFAGETPDAEPNAELDQVLGDFKASVHAWSAAEYSRPRIVHPVRRPGWQPAASWVMGCVLVAGSLTGGLYEQHHRRELARIAAAEQARQQQLAVEERTQQEDANLLATVDSDVSREVPSAMEPLAQLMDEDTNR